MGKKGREKAKFRVFFLSNGPARSQLFVQSSVVSAEENDQLEFPRSPTEFE